MAGRVIRAEKGSDMEKVLNHRKGYGGAGSQTNKCAGLFELKVRQAILRAFEDIPAKAFADEGGNGLPPP